MDPGPTDQGIGTQQDLAASTQDPRTLNPESSDYSDILLEGRK